VALVYTLDASVVLNAFLPHEVDHQQSLGLLRELIAQGLPLVEPTLLLAEVAATLSRGQPDPVRARHFVESLARLPGLVLVALDSTLGRQAAAIAADHRLRGADAVYAATALRFGATLVSRDREQLERAAATVPTREPTQAYHEIVA